MKVLHVITGLNTGGAEIVLCRLLESLPQFEHNVVALAGEGVLSARVRSTGASLVHLDMKPGRISLQALRRLRRLVREEQPDVIHAWLHHANLVASLATWGLPVPVFWSIRQSLYNIHLQKWSTRVVIRANRWLSRRPTRILYNSFIGLAQHERFGFNSKRRLVIPNGFDTGIFRPDSETRIRLRCELNIPESAFVIGLIARWHPMKDHENFLHAAALFAARNDRAMFVLAGDGVNAGNKSLTERVQELDLMDRIRLCGRSNDTAAVNAALDVASSSSSWGEAFPNAIGEAMACGVPCVATDVGDVREIIDDTGVVVPPRDPGALCDAWLQIAMLDSVTRRALGGRARLRIIERYNLTNVSQQYIECYREAARQT